MEDDNPNEIFSSIKKLISDITAVKELEHSISEMERSPDSGLEKLLDDAKKYAEATYYAKSCASDAKYHKLEFLESMGVKSLSQIYLPSISTNDFSYFRYATSKSDAKECTLDYYKARKSYRDSRKALISKLRKLFHEKIDEIEDSDTDPDVEFDDGFCYECAKGGRGDVCCRCPPARNPYFDSDHEDQRIQDREDELRRQSD